MSPGTRIQQVNEEFPQLLPVIKAAKDKASKVNIGQVNEEITITAKYHVCNHDEPNTPCEPWVEI